MNLYPLGNVSPSIYRATLVGTQPCSIRRAPASTSTPSSTDQLFARYSYSGRLQHQPDLRARHRRAGLSDPRRSRRPTRRSLSSTHIFSPSLTNSLRGSCLRHEFFFDQRLNQTPPSALGFGYDSSNADRTGPAVLQRQRLHADRRRHHRPAQLHAEHLRGAGRAVVDARLAPGEVRRRVTGTPRSTCSRRSRRTRSSSSPGRSRPTTRSPTCCSARR